MVLAAVTWTGDAVGGDWGDGMNWTDEFGIHHPPGAGDIVSITLAPNGQIMVPAAGGDAFSIQSNSEIQITAGRLTVVDDVTFTSPGRFTVYGGEIQIGGTMAGTMHMTGGAIIGTLTTMNSALALDGGTGTVTAFGQTSFGSFGLSQGFEVTVMGTVGLSAALSGSLSIGGHVILDDTGGWDASLNSPSQPIVIGTFGRLTVAPGGGGLRHIAGSIINLGEMRVESQVSMSSATARLQNEGVLSIGRVGVQASLRMEAGDQPLEMNAPGAVLSFHDGGRLISAGGEFIFRGGRIDGGRPEFTDTRLQLLAAGQNDLTHIDLFGIILVESDIATRHVLHVSGIAGLSASIRQAEGHENHGTIELSDTSGWDAEYIAADTEAGDAAHNAADGTVRILAGDGGGRRLVGRILNAGLVDIQAPTIFVNDMTSDFHPDPEGVLRNLGELRITGPGSLTAVGNNLAVHLNAGTGAGSIRMDAANRVFFIDCHVRFESGQVLKTNGQSVDSHWLVLQNASLQIDAPPAAASELVWTLRGTTSLISSQVPSGHRLVVEAVAGLSAELQMAQIVIVHGSIVLTDLAGWDSAIVQTGSPVNYLALANTGSMVIAAGEGGARTLRTTISNAGHIDIQAPVTMPVLTTSLQNLGLLTVQSGAQLLLAGNGSGGPGLILNTGITPEDGVNIMQGGRIRIDDGSRVVYFSSRISGRIELHNGNLSLQATAPGAGHDWDLTGTTTILNAVIPSQHRLHSRGIAGLNAEVFSQFGLQIDGKLILTSESDWGSNILVGVAGDQDLTLGASGILALEGGGQRAVQARIVSSGTLDIQSTLQLVGAVASHQIGGIMQFTGDGRLQMNVPGQSLTLAGSIIDMDGGSAERIEVDAGVVVFAGGRSNTAPRLRSSSVLNLNASPAVGTVGWMLLGDNTLATNIPFGHDVQVIAQPSQPASLTKSTALMVNGHLRLIDAGGFGTSLTIGGTGILTVATGARLETVGTGQAMINARLVNNGETFFGRNTQVNRASAQHSNTGRLLIAGTEIAFTGNRLSNSGTVEITAGSILNVNGAFQQTATGTTKIEVFGPSQGADNGSLSATGTVTVAGTITIDFGAFEPMNELDLTLITGSSVVGSYGTTNLPNVPGVELDLLVEPTQIRLTAAIHPFCPADWNHDGIHDSQDFFDFLDAFFTGDADFNGFDGTDSQDYFDFLNAFFIGCE